VSVPINILASPGSSPTGALVTDTVTLAVSIGSLFFNIPYSQQPSLAITGGMVPSEPIQ
jgi:hypothetical protein